MWEFIMSTVILGSVGWMLFKIMYSKPPPPDA